MEKWQLAMVCISVLEGFALYLKISGIPFSLVVAVLGRLGGYEVAKLRQNKEVTQNLSGR